MVKVKHVVIVWHALLESIQLKFIQTYEQEEIKEKLVKK